MNGQTAFMGSSFLPLHSYGLHGVHQQQQQLHHQRIHPTQGQFSDLAPSSSAGFSGVAQRGLPFRPAGLPVVVDCTHTHSNHRQGYPHPNQNNHNHSHSHLHHDAFLHPSTLRMGSFEQSPDEELARLQELSNKWEPEANASRSQSISPRVPLLSLPIPSHRR